MIADLPCMDFIERLDDYVEGRMTPDERARWDKHLSICSACTDYLRTYRDTIALARRSGTADPQALGLPEGLLAAIAAAMASDDADDA